MTGADVSLYARANEGLNATVVKGFLAEKRKKLRLEPETAGVQRLEAAGAFNTAAVMDFHSKVRGEDEETAPALTIHPARPMATGHSVGQLFADGSVGISVKVGPHEWI